MKEKNKVFSISFIILFFIIFFCIFSFFIYSGFEIQSIKEISLVKMMNFGLFQVLVSNLWLLLFFILSIIPLSLLFSFFLYFFIFDNENKESNKFFKRFYIKFLNFFSDIPESIWTLSLFSFFCIFLKLQKSSIFFFAILLFFCLFFLTTKSLLKIFKKRDLELTSCFKENNNIIEVVLFNMIPKISKDLGILTLKILSIISSIGLVFICANNFFFFDNNISESKIPGSFSENGETVLSEIYILLLKIKNSPTDYLEYFDQILFFSFILFFIQIFIFILKKFLKNN